MKRGNVLFALMVIGLFGAGCRAVDQQPQPQAGQPEAELVEREVIIPQTEVVAGETFELPVEEGQLERVAAEEAEVVYEKEEA